MRIHRIELSEFDAEAYQGGWVDIRDTRSWADTKRIEGASLEMTRAGNGTEEVLMRVDLLARALMVLETAIVAWSLTGEDGQPLPATRSGYSSDQFDAELGEWLMERIEAHYEAGRRTATERKN
jgi:hypothetical protein